MIVSPREKFPNRGIPSNSGEKLQSPQKPRANSRGLIVNAHTRPFANNLLDSGG